MLNANNINLFSRFFEYVYDHHHCSGPEIVLIFYQLRPRLHWVIYEIFFYVMLFRYLYAVVIFEHLCISLTL